MTSTRLSIARSVRNARLVARLTAGLFLMATGCAESGDSNDDFGAPVVGSDAATPIIDAGSSFPTPVVDASTSYPIVDSGSVTQSDAGSVAPADAGTKPSDAGSTTTSDSSVKPSDAGGSASSDGGFTIPDIFGDGGLKLPDLFPTTDAGSSTTDAGSTTTTDGGRDPRGPCKDLNLICFDFIDMWINAECQTCNNGKGCQGCNIPFAY